MTNKSLFLVNVMNYVVENKGQYQKNVVLDDGSGLMLPPFKEVSITQDEYESKRLQKLINEYSSDVVDKSYEEEKNLEEKDNSDSDSLEDKDRSDLMTLASERNYEDKTEEKIVEADKEELIQFIKNDRDSE